VDVKKDTGKSRKIKIKENKCHKLVKWYTQMGRSEELGTGIKKLYKYCKHYSGSEEIEFIVKDVFVTIIPLNKKKEIDNDTNIDTDDRLKKILELMNANLSITTKNLSELLNVTQITVKRDIEKLKKEGKLKRVGTAKGGYWEVVIR
jgi:ATP-dependent DNA helicase RecG